MYELKGVIPYLVSPVMEEGKINVKELKRLSNDLIDKGVHGLCALGSSGEFPYLSSKQKDIIVSTVVQVANERGVPAIAGASGFSESQAIDEAIRFAKLGVDAIVLMIQCYFPLSEDMIIHFIKSVSAAIPDKTIIIYSNPQYMHFTFSMKIFESILDCQNVQYFKDASGNTGFLMALTNHFGDRFKLFSASAHIPLFVLELGGVGWMAGPACIIPKQSVNLYNLFKQGKLDLAMSLQRKIWNVNQMFAKYDLAACLKTVLRYQGYEVGNPLSPLLEISPEAGRKIWEVVNSLDT